MTAQWLADAACRHPEVDPDIFFPNTRISPQAALAWCRDCPVRIECLAYATTRPGTVGVWGGRLFGPRYGTSVCRNGHTRPPGRRCMECHRQSARRRRLTAVTT